MTQRACLGIARAGLGGVVLLLASVASGIEFSAVRPEGRAAARPPGPQLESLRREVPRAGPFRPTADPSLDGSPVEYLILTSDAMAPEFERLAAYKTAKGVPAVVRTLGEVEAELDRLRSNRDLNPEASDELVSW